MKQTKKQKANVRKVFLCCFKFGYHFITIFTIFFPFLKTGKTRLRSVIRLNDKVTLLQRWEVNVSLCDSNLNDYSFTILQFPHLSNQFCHI